MKGMGIRLDREMRIDLHMHTTVSDGTDSPLEILGKVRKKKIRIFSITDHDDTEGCVETLDSLGEGQDKESLCQDGEGQWPLTFLTGVELSSRDEEGKYHILGYGYDPGAEAMQRLIQRARNNRFRKMEARMEGLERVFHFSFPKEEIEALFSMRNPGKPHIGNLCVKYGYAPTKQAAITDYINKLHTPRYIIGPEEVIRAIRESGGIPVLAHPVFGSGSQYVVGEELEKRVLHLREMGLEGLECYYSGFSPELIRETCLLAERYQLYVTAGSDYHGKNKSVVLGENHYCPEEGIPEGMKRFFERVKTFGEGVGT